MVGIRTQVSPFFAQYPNHYTTLPLKQATHRSPPGSLAAARLLTDWLAARPSRAFYTGLLELSGAAPIRRHVTSRPSSAPAGRASRSDRLRGAQGARAGARDANAANPRAESGAGPARVPPPSP